MRNIFKRVLITALLLCTSAFACFAACGKNDQNQNFTNNDVSDLILSSDGKSVIGLKDHNLTHLNVSSSYNGIEVTSINDKAFYNCASLVSVTLPDTITSINEGAFWGCSSLASITIPDCVTNIGNNAFFRCVKLVEVINKSGLKITKGSLEDNGYLGYYALNVKTEGISDIVNKDDYLFYTHDNVNYLLGYVGTETELTLPESYNGRSYEIYKYAFYNCDLLTSVIISDGVTKIGDNSFYGCRSLKNVTIGNNVANIRSYAFYNCDLLTSVTFLDSYGWYVEFNNPNATSGINLTLNSASKNATYLKSTYDNYYWFRKS